jgi:hypothetical protein
MVLQQPLDCLQAPGNPLGVVEPVDPEQDRPTAGVAADGRSACRDLGIVSSR